MKEVPEDIQKLLKQLVDRFDQDDNAVRDRQIKQWKRLKLIWEGFQRTWYSEVAHDWRVWDEAADTNNNTGAYYDKPVNVFRAYLESIIAALSINVPSIKCFPDDADNPLDLSTARAGDKIAELIYRHNDVTLLWLHALFIFCTEGLTACYSYPKEAEEYGTYEEKEYEESSEEQYVCPFCQTNMPDNLFLARVKDEYMPGDDSVTLKNITNENAICPQCSQMVNPDLQKSQLIVTRLVGITTKPKTRICLEAYGGLYVKVPNYAMRQEDCPYLFFMYETHISNVMHRYPKLKNKEGERFSRGVFDSEEQLARLSPQYYGEFPNDNVTVRNVWLRPSAFCTLEDEEDVDKLKKAYPDGAKVVMINDCFADAENESLDDCWTLSRNPLADYLHHDPLGLQLTSIQDITNDMVSLVLQTIEHGIPQTFADPAVLNFEQYKQSEVIPGGIYPVTPRTGKSVGDAFHEVKTATLSQEVIPFLEKIQEFGQLVSGALPSLFGGQQEGSRTASEYSMSRAQALQRQQNNWKIFTVWWKTIFGKVIPMYIKEVKDDEKSVELDEQGNFINVFIRKAELEGKIGRVELEASENMPITVSQRRDMIQKLAESPVPQIMELLTAPENLPFLRESLGMHDLTIPGEDDRQKQYEEIKLLVNSEPIQIPTDPMEMQIAAAMGQQLPPFTEQSSVPIDELVDNNDIEAVICRSYLVSEAGRLLRVENPLGYKNVLLHMKAHMDKIAEDAQMMQPPPEQGNPGNTPKPQGNATPLAGNENARTVQ